MAIRLICLCETRFLCPVMGDETRVVREEAPQWKEQFLVCWTTGQSEESEGGLRWGGDVLWINNIPARIIWSESARES